MNHYIHVIRMLNKIFSKQIPLRVYISYIQSKLDYGLSVLGSTTEGNIDRVQIIKNFCARIICKKYDYINTRGIDLVESLEIQTIRQRRDYFLSVLMFKCIHGLAPHNLILPWLLMYMIIILEVQKIGIYMFHSVTKNFANAVLHIKEVPLKWFTWRSKIIWFHRRF